MTSSPPRGWGWGRRTARSELHMETSFGASTEFTSVRIPIPAGRLDGSLVVPPGAGGIVAFAHGSGSSRHSPRNQRVARAFERGRLGTLLFDLLTEDEGREDSVTATYRFDIPLLAGRLVAAIDYLSSEPSAALPIGCFGSSTGAAAALIAAVERPGSVRAVVSRGGRPDLAGGILSEVHAPTLLIVGGRDAEVLELNRWALARLGGVKRLEVVDGATHLFEEPGAMERVVALASAWFHAHLQIPQRTSPS